MKKILPINDRKTTEFIEKHEVNNIFTYEIWEKGKKYTITYELIKIEKEELK